MRNRSSGFTTTTVLVLLSVAFLASLGFSYWAFSGRQDYKNHANVKINAAVAAAKKEQAAQLQAQYEQAAKAPYKTFTGTPTYGTISFSYPKTWSAYVDTTNQSQPIEAYFYPGEVPSIQSDTAFPLRVELIDTEYSQVIQQFSSQISSGSVKAAAYLPPKMKNVPNAQPGTRFDGSINQASNGPQQGAMVVIKVRDKTLQISTESNNNLADFNNIILPSLSFVP